MDIGQRLCELLQARQMSQKTLATNTNLTPSYINQICTGKKKPTIETLEVLCNALSIPIEDFFSGKSNNASIPLSSMELHVISNLRNLNLAEQNAICSLVHSLSMAKKEHTDCSRHVDGYAAAGSPLFDPIDPETCVPVPPRFLDRDRFIIIEARGDSMEPEIWDGDYVIVARDQQPEQGEVALVSIEGITNDEYVIKRFYKKNGDVELRSFNPRYSPKFYPLKEIHSAQRVVHIIRRKQD